jgi:hypothetical protein
LAPLLIFEDRANFGDGLANSLIGFFDFHGELDSGQSQHPLCSDTGTILKHMSSTLNAEADIWYAREMLKTAIFSLLIFDGSITSG